MAWYLYTPLRLCTDTPYYISEEPITKRLWHKVMNLPMNEAWSQIIVDKTDEEWYKFLEKCRKLSHEPLSFASQEEINKAIDRSKKSNIN